MTRNNIQLSLLFVVFIAGFISFGTCCTDFEFKCRSGQCIDLDELCDGNIDCDDGTDEVADSCVQQECPSFAFRCAYGACVAGTAKCNGKKECADNSDETSSLCSPDGMSMGFRINNSTCSDEEFQCTSGLCISSDSACDGRSDCKDQSDETVEVCASFNCPKFAFRCGYGACIIADKKCNGVPDCRDGSDETRKLCGSQTPSVTTRPTIPTRPTRPGPTQPTKRPTRPTPTPPPEEPSGCPAPIIPNSRLLYEAEPSKVIGTSAIVANGISIIFECTSGFNREGLQFNLCFDSKWQYFMDTKCVKYCPQHILKGVTFRAECEYDGKGVPCDDRIRPRTTARISCRVKYRKPDRNPPDVLVCQDDGQWDYQPFRCEPVCGEELIRSTPFAVNANPTNITYVPWHVGIYQKLSGVYKHNCGATIVSAKVVISAAHCFWDFANQMVYDKSFYVVGAGKYLRDYYQDEPNAMYSNVSEIAIPTDEFKGEHENLKGDIAVLVLTTFLKFSPFIAPVCIEWYKAGAKAIESNVYGRIAGWGIDETGKFSADLRSVDVPSSSYSDCRKAVGPELSVAVTTDKFCVLNEFGSVVCQGDSGGGFTVKNRVGNRNVNYLWGIVSGGVPRSNKCSEFSFVSYTNVQYYETLIRSRMTSNRPN